MTTICLAGAIFVYLATHVVTAAQNSDVVQKSLEGREAEIKYTMKLDAKHHEQRRCKANLSLGYLQKNTVASVDSVLVNDQCGASSGSYVVAVRVKDEAGELHTTEYEESWQRSDSTPLEMTKEYAIGDGVDLINVRAKRLRCLCAEPLPEAEDQ